MNQNLHIKCIYPIIAQDLEILRCVFGRGKEKHECILHFHPTSRNGALGDHLDMVGGLEEIIVTRKLKINLSPLKACRDVVEDSKHFIEHTRNASSSVIN